MSENQVNYQANFKTEDEIDLLEIFAKLWRKKRTIILLTAIPTLLAVAFALFKMERVNLYKATTTINSYQEKESSNKNYYQDLIKSAVAGEKFLQEVQKQFPSVTIQNFRFSFDESKKKSQQLAGSIAISVVSADQELVEPVANLAPVVIQKVLSEDYPDQISQSKERKRLKEESVVAYRNNLALLKSKIEKAKSQEDADYLLTLVSSLNASLASIEKSSVFDYSKVKVLDRAKRPTLSIRDQEILKKKRESELSGKWKSKKVIVLVTFFTFFFLSVMLVLLLDFIKNNKDKFREYLDQ